MLFESFCFMELIAACNCKVDAANFSDSVLMKSTVGAMPTFVFEGRLKLAAKTSRRPTDNMPQANLICWI
jgi:hypothetical protein